MIFICQIYVWFYWGATGYQFHYQIEYVSMRLMYNLLLLVVLQNPQSIQQSIRLIRLKLIGIVFHMAHRWPISMYMFLIDGCSQHLWVLLASYTLEGLGWHGNILVFQNSRKNDSSTVTYWKTRQKGFLEQGIVFVGVKMAILNLSDVSIFKRRFMGYV